MQTVLIVLHVILGIMIVAIVLLQGGSDELKGLGSSGVDNIMSPSTSASFITKLTAVLAALFIINCLALANLSSRGSRKSIADKIVKEQKADKQPIESAPLAN